ncbi:alkyl hydroperoxide reductase [Longibacter salinarum]|uniref:Alkyl hydroperoxide reductase n=1 Tax=Longibacter salinarum TaxID=1850348 RepID=A0A2A8CXF4_9BACT|nr:peroxiredoxin-like family protein [Longibacter salinarum]PEN13303.1 alkyl hydroperoxide reductase [Longibacter salinarum]
MPTTPRSRQSAPALSFPTIGGGNWSLQDQSPENFTLIVFYRGLHCPVCKSYLETLSDVQSDYADLGVEMAAVSMDTKSRARKTRMDWGIGDYPLGYNLDLETANAWGLYLSEGIKEGEPDLFSEPGLFLVCPDGRLYYSAINSAPWGRPHLPSFRKTVDYIVTHDYPARGEHGS